MASEVLKVVVQIHLLILPILPCTSIPTGVFEEFSVSSLLFFPVWSCPSSERGEGSWCCICQVSHTQDSSWKHWTWL